MGSKLDRIKEIAKSLMSPDGRSSSAEDVMDKRKKKLETMGGKNPGGMFDIIYKKTREKNKALDEIEY